MVGKGTEKASKQPKRYSAKSSSKVAHSIKASISLKSKKEHGKTWNREFLTPLYLTLYDLLFRLQS
ncbi:MAG: hypothetical protein ACPLKZ_07310 [Candidatus Bathyarchaeales archaeon]